MQFSQVFRSSIGKKLLLGATGLIWASFIIVHLIENLLLFAGPEPFNKYVHALTSLGPILYVAELFLLATLLLHFFYAIKVTLENNSARSIKYIKSGSAGGASKKGIATSTMIYTGLLLITFIIIHLFNFKFADHQMVTYGSETMVDLYHTVISFFANPLNVTFYVVIMILLGTHLSHGFWSAFQSLGLNGRRFTPFIHSFGIIVASLLAIGFVGIPLFFLFTGGAA